MRHAINTSKSTSYSTSSKLGSSPTPAVSSPESQCQVKTFNSDSSGCDSNEQNEGNSLAELLPNAEFFSGRDVLFNGVARSPSTAQAGQLVAYRIGEHDPAKVIAEAMARGAAGLITEQVLPCPLPQCIVGDMELAMATITAHTAGHPDRNMLTIGVVGSAGKTTTALLIASLLRDSGTRAAYQTDLGESDGIVQSTTREKLPSGQRLVEWLSDAKDAGCSATVIELSNDDARYGLYESVQFDILVVTGEANVSEDFGPSGLQCVLDRLKNKGVVVASSDDPKAIRVIRDTGAQLISFGIRNRADVTAKIIEQSCGMTTLMISQGDTTSIMETPLCGSAMASNHLAAAVVGMLIDQPLAQVTESLSRFRCMPGRFQRLSNMEHADVIIDAANTPQRAVSVLQAARSMKSGGQLWCVLTIAENNSIDQLNQLGGHLERFANQAVITCERTMKNSFLQASHHVLDGVEKCASMRLVADQTRALEWAIREANPNDTILVIGGSSAPNAHEERTNIQALTKRIDQARKSVGKPALVPEQAANRPRNVISMFGTE